MKGLLAGAQGFGWEYRFPLTLFAVLRVWTLVWAVLVTAFVAPSAEATKHYNGMEPLRDAIIAPWQRWDTVWYQKIAQEGYAPDLRTVFPPFYPLLLRISAPLTQNNFVAAGLIVSSLATLAALLLFYRLAWQMYDEPAARRGMIFLGAFPTAFYLFAAYTEPLFLAFVLGAFLCVRKQQWVAGGILAALAAMTRAQGLFLLLPFAIEFWQQYRAGRIAPTRIWVFGMVAFGSLTHFLWLAMQFGTLDVWFQAQTQWHQMLPPWETVAHVGEAILSALSLPEAGLSLVQALMEVLLLGTVLWSWRRLPFAFTAYVAILAFPPLFLVTTYSSLFPFTGVGRFALLAFPFFLLLGAIPQGKWQLPLAALFFVVQIVWMMLFVAWVFVH